MGTAFRQRYVLMGPIGQGGVSIVYHAVDTVRRQPMAIKMLAPTHAGDTVARERVRREALITNMLRHPSVPKVYDFGDAPLPDGSVVPYVVMELLTGVMLAAKLAAGRAALAGGRAHHRDDRRRARRGAPAGRRAPRPVRREHHDHTTGVKLIDFGLAVTTKPLTGRLTAAPTRRVTSGRLRRPCHRPTRRPAQPAPAHPISATGAATRPTTCTPSAFCSTRCSPAARRIRAARRAAPAAGRARGSPPAGCTTRRRRPVLSVPGMPREIADITRACMAKRPAERPGESAPWRCRSGRSCWRPAPATPVPSAP